MQEKQNIQNTLQTLLDVGAVDLLPGFIAAARRCWSSNALIQSFLDDMEVRFVKSLGN